MKKKYDYIIVGQGIAGTVLAYTLLSKGKNILIIDNEKQQSTSLVSAGLYNPVVFKRLVRSWMIDDLLPVMTTFYADKEALLGKQFYFKKNIVKLFADKTEQEFWLKKTEEPVGKYLNKKVDLKFQDEYVKNPFGAAEVNESGYLDKQLFLTASRNYFIQKNLLLNEAVAYTDISVLDNGIKYKNKDAEKIIFCEGHHALENPYFNWLPFKLTKGEMLTIKFNPPDKLPSDKVINKDVFVLPLGNGLYKVGATYQWDNLNEEITEKGKNELIENLKKNIHLPFEIIHQQAGIRPTVVDRRPLIGLHPKHASLAVFNGMGTKGVMLAPYFAEQFSNFLINGTPLHKEVDCKRYLQN